MPERLPHLHVYDSNKEQAREIQIMQGLIDGDTREQISTGLGIANSTTSYYIQRLKGEEPGDVGLYNAIRIAIKMGRLNTDSLPKQYDTQVIGQKRDLVVRILKGADSKEVRDLEDELFKLSGIANRYQLVAIAEVERLRAGNV